MKDNLLTASVVGALLLAIATFFGGMHIGRQTEQAHGQLEQLHLQEAQQADLLAEINQRHADRMAAEARARKASQDYENSLSKKDRYYVEQLAAVKRAGGLRIPAAVCPGQAASASPAAGAGGPDEAGATTVELPERTQERLFALTNRADSLAEQLRGLEAWVVDNGLYGQNTLHSGQPGQAAAGP